MGIIRTFKKQKKKLIQKISRPLSKEDIQDGIRRLGLQKNDTVFVHSSLSKFGSVSGGPKTVLDAITSYFAGEGTVLFPGFNIQGSASTALQRHTTPDNPYDYRTSVPSTGILCRVFKTDYCTDISIHPTHSVLGVGKHAKEITIHHLEAETTFGTGTPFAKLMDFDARIVGLGSDFGHVTFVHALEDLEKDFPVAVYEDIPYTVFLHDYDGKVVTKTVKAHRAQKSRIERPSGTYIRRKFWNDLRKSGKLKTCYIGKAQCWAVSSRDLYYYLVSEMKNGRTIYSEAPTALSRKFNEILGWFHEINR